MKKWLHNLAYKFFRKYLRVYNVVDFTTVEQVKLSKNDIIAYKKERLASDIGREMLKNGMIKVKMNPDYDLQAVRLELSVTVFTPITPPRKE